MIQQITTVLISIEYRFQELKMILIIILNQMNQVFLSYTVQEILMLITVRKKIVEKIKIKYWDIKSNMNQFK